MILRELAQTKQSPAAFVARSTFGRFDSVTATQFVRYAVVGLT